jgi:hypothetical protein
MCSVCGAARDALPALFFVQPRSIARDEESRSAGTGAAKSGTRPASNGQLFLGIGAPSAMRRFMGVAALGAPDAVIVCLMDTSQSPQFVLRQNGESGEPRWVEAVRATSARREWYAAASTIAAATKSPGVILNAFARSELDVPLTAIASGFTVEIPAGRFTLLRVSEDQVAAWAGESPSADVQLVALPFFGAVPRWGADTPSIEEVEWSLLEQVEPSTKDEPDADDVDLPSHFSASTDTTANDQRELSPWASDAIARALDPEDAPTLVVAVALPVVSPLPSAISEQRYLETQCPDTVAMGSEFRVTCALKLKRGTHATTLTPIDVPYGGRPVAVGLAVGQGLEVVTPGWVVCTIHPGKDSADLEFIVRVIAMQPGLTLLSFVVEMSGQCVGGAKVDIRISTATTPPRPQPPAQLNRSRLEDGDVMISIVCETVGGVPRLRHYWRDAWYQVVPERTIELGSAHALLLADARLEVRRLVRERPAAPVSLTRTRLRAIGMRMWALFVPPEIQTLFSTYRDEIRRVLLVTDDTTIPWELLYPTLDDYGFLVEQVPVTRWPSGRQPVDTLYASVTHVAVPGNAPASATREAEIVREIMSRKGQSESITDFTRLAQAVEAGQFHMLHFACHDLFTQDNLNFGGIPFGVSLLNTANLALSPLIFVNAGRSIPVDDEVFSALQVWAQTAIERRAAAFVSPRWDVTSDAAIEFAQTFYEALVNGTPLGDAAMRARAAITARPGDPSWLAYAIYGDPRAHL